MQLFLKGELRVSQRASWTAGICTEKYPELIKPYYKSLLDNLKKKGLHNAVIRNTIRIFQFVKVPAKYHGTLMNSCFDLIQTHETPVAIKAFSLTVLFNLSHDYPDIIPEIRLVIQDRYEHETPAFTSRARKILTMMERSEQRSNTEI
jgi:hypothetical protein